MYTSGLRYGFFVLFLSFSLTRTAFAQLEGRLYLDKVEYRLGEPVYLHFDLTNTGTAHEARKHGPNQARDCTLAAAQLGGEDAMPYVSSLLAGSDPFSRANGVMALPQTGSRHAVPLLIELLRSPDLSVGRLASIGLIHLTHRSPFSAGQWFSDAPSNEYSHWMRWWMRERDRATIYGPDQCGKIDPLK